MLARWPKEKMVSVADNILFELSYLQAPNLLNITLLLLYLPSFTYRFMATGTVEEKIFQRQLSKEGLQSVVDDKQQVNELSSKDLKNLFKVS